jgi:NAD(P)-dependent dehydrogenase (short-subunit alcohol dehydrogenase family)
MKLDLSNIESIKQFSYTFMEEFARLDILINNAGVMALPLMRTSQGFEMQFGTNHLGHFVLTAMLIDLIIKSPGARIVNVSSMAYKYGRIGFDDLNCEKTYSKWKAYSQSKLANLLFTIELDRRLKMSGKTTIAVSAHPGYAATNLQLRAAELEGAKFKKSMMRFSNALLAQHAKMGALPVLYAAVSPLVKPAGFYGPGGFFHMRGYPVEEKMDMKVVNPLEAPKLWTESEKLTGIRCVIR